MIGAEEFTGHIVQHGVQFLIKHRRGQSHNLDLVDAGIDVGLCLRGQVFKGTDQVAPLAVVRFDFQVVRFRVVIICYILT